MATGAKRWIMPISSLPYIIDLDMQAVDSVSPWIKARLRFVSGPYEMKALSRSAPRNRLYALDGRAAENTVFFRDEADLPEAVLEKLAVLRVAAPDIHYPGVGKVWGTSGASGEAGLFVEFNTEKFYDTIRTGG